MLAQLLVSGLILGSVYALIALGFVLIYKSTTIINFCQGELVMAGAYLALFYSNDLGWPLAVAFGATIVSSFALGLVIQVVLRPLMDAPRWNVIMATFGLSFVLKSLARLYWGASVYPFPPYLSTTPREVLGVVVTPQRVGIMLITATVMIFLYAFFQFTRIGTALRAASQSRRAAQLVGIRVFRVHALSWGLSGLLGGLSGLLLAPIIPVHPDMGGVALKGFTASVIGGFLSFPGAIVGGLIVGMAEALAAGFVAAGLEEVVALLLLVLVLLIKPSGLFAERVTQRV